MPKNGEGNVNPLQYSCLENSMGRGAWWATVGHHLVTKRFPGISAAKEFAFNAADPVQFPGREIPLEKG